MGDVDRTCEGARSLREMSSGPTVLRAGVSGVDGDVPGEVRTPIFAGLVREWAAEGRELPPFVPSFGVCGVCRVRHPPPPGVAVVIAASATGAEERVRARMAVGRRVPR